MKVYVAATRGCYSDYVYGVFSSRATFEEYKKNMRLASAAAKDLYLNYDWNPLQEYEVDEGLKEKLFHQYGVSLWLKSGDVVKEEPPWKAYRFGIAKSDVYIVESVPGFNGEGIVRARSHRSKEHALKIAAEARQAWLREHREQE